MLHLQDRHKYLRNAKVKSDYKFVVIVTMCTFEFVVSITFW